MNPVFYSQLEKIFARQRDNYHYNWKEDLKNTDSAMHTRIEDELTGFGPLQKLLEDECVSEILVNGYTSVYCERAGRLERCSDHFFSFETYQSFLDRLAQLCGTYMNREKPFLECQYRQMRITVIYPEIANGHTLLSIRKSPQDVWTLAELQRRQWCSSAQLQLIYEIMRNRRNFLIVGNTSSGKTSFLQALLQEIPPLERAVIIEDTRELSITDSSSVSLLTRQDPSGAVPDVTMDDLLKRALRLRPDRLVVGEIRGGEAKSLLMALSSGHQGSFGSLHAHSAANALLRLEMLIQMGAPQWNLNSIRRLLAMTVQYILVTEKKDQTRRLKGIYELGAVEENGLLLTRTDGTDEEF